MASVTTEANGRRRIDWRDADGRARVLRLGLVPMEHADYVKRRVEELLRDRSIQRPHDPELCRWLNALPDALHAKLERVGLAAPRGPGSKVPAPLAELSTLNWVGLPPGASLPGIYFLMFDGEVVYVGKGVVVGARAIAHMKSDKRYDGFYFINCAIEELDRLERRWIRKLLPKHNRMTYEGV